MLARCGCRSAATALKGIYAPGDNPYPLRRILFGEERSLLMFALRLNQFYLSRGPANTGTASANSSLSRAVPMFRVDRDELEPRANDA
jgi:hypothetical protein